MTDFAHIRCGDDMRPAFEASSLTGRFIRWADPLCEGPTPGDVDAQEWRSLRAGYAAARYGVSLQEAERFLDEQESALEASVSAAEIILWFEHDQFDQFILIRLLDWFAARKIDQDRLSLVCIDHYPGIEHFHGIGQLGADALDALFTERVPVSLPQFALARRAWAAFCSADPRGLEVLLTEDTSDLPFLAGAILRHFEDFPGTLDGLARTERNALLAAASGDANPGEIFGVCQAMEEARWCGDTMFWGWLRALAHAPMPALVLTGPDDWYRSREGIEATKVGLTRAGHAMMRGAANWVRMGGVDRWMGGVHLEGREATWQWDNARRKLVDGAGRHG
ncbi:MAG TPA: DUF1835 domain-containing protein [Alphaproteobacteria bacterium]|nr:DUF1835 domain-containing protein [Alphaproteobacteria bacterium]